ncbi:hypothetical protein JTE90_000073 [Oedothorax gibbosus]|uniref:Uncharacterized protein n=1 Tax=Oedothorax gibbosus TaxID=931172 RepID=A0AAV6UE06_9ARAC|nr:hypothetical protein JTE90_000073 [Oedothorax gibbosus]
MCGELRSPLAEQMAHICREGRRLLAGELLKFSSNSKQMHVHTNYILMSTPTILKTPQNPFTRSWPRNLKAQHPLTPNCPEYKEFKSPTPLKSYKGSLSAIAVGEELAGEIASDKTCQ